MVFVVEMCAGKPMAPACQSGFRYFTCGAKTWEAAVRIGQECGWKPSGTIPADDRAREWYGARFKPDYEVPDIAGNKEITTDDAAAWADALERALLSGRFLAGARQEARPVLLIEGHDEEQFRQANQGMDARFLIDFISFLRKGGFCFFWDD
jgi:hypothetical protein